MYIVQCTYYTYVSIVLAEIFDGYSTRRPAHMFTISVRAL